MDNGVKEGELMSGFEVVSIIFLFPLLALITSIIGYIYFKRWIVMPLVIFLIFLLYMFTNYNKTFFFWVIVYTVISLIVSIIMKWLYKKHG